MKEKRKKLTYKQASKLAKTLEKAGLSNPKFIKQFTKELAKAIVKSIKENN